jgi:hypothetical protein
MNYIQRIISITWILFTTASISGCFSYYPNILPTEGISSKNTKVSKILDKEARESKAQQEMQNQQQQMQSIMNQQLIYNKK